MLAKSLANGNKSGQFRQVLKLIRPGHCLCAVKIKKAKKISVYATLIYDQGNGFCPDNSQ